MTNPSGYVQLRILCPPRPHRPHRCRNQVDDASPGHARTLCPTSPHRLHRYARAERRVDGDELGAVCVGVVDELDGAVDVCGDDDGIEDDDFDEVVVDGVLVDGTVGIRRKRTGCVVRRRRVVRVVVVGNDAGPDLDGAVVDRAMVVAKAGVMVVRIEW